MPNMTNVTEETVTLARQLYCLWWEAVGYVKIVDDSGWNSLIPAEQTAWIMVAQHMEARLRAVVDVSLDLGRMMQEPDHK